MKKIILRIPKFVLTVISVLVILYLTLFPDPAPHIRIPLFVGADKVIHAIMFAFFAGALVVDFYRVNYFGKNISRLYAFCLVVSFVFGGLVEILQAEMGLGRSGDIYDLIADVIGAAIGMIVAKYIFFKK